MKFKNKLYSFLALVVATTIICTHVSPAMGKFVANNPINVQTSISVAISNLEQGKKLYDAGRFAEAVKFLQQAVKEYQQQGDTLRQAATLSNLSLAYQELGNWNQAQQAITASLKLLTANSEKTANLGVFAQSLDVQASLQLSMRQTDAALRSWQQAAEIYTKINDNSGVVRSQINQAQVLRIQGFYQKSIKLLNQVQQQLQSQPDSLEKVVSLRSLGDSLQLAGNLSAAQKVLQQSLEIAQRLQSFDHVAASLLSLGNNAHAEGKITEALVFYQQVVKIAPSPLTKVQAQLNQLKLMIEQGKSAQAQTLLPEIQSQIAQLPPSSLAIYARINFVQNLLKLGGENLTLKNSQLIASAIQQARDLGDKRAEAYGLGTLGHFYEQTQQWNEAQKLTEQALFLTQTHNAPEIAYRWQWQLGRIFKAQGNIQDAILAYDGSLATLDSLRSDLVTVNQDVQLSFRDSVEPVYRESVEILLRSQADKPDEKILEKARQRIEALQLAELDNFFREACLQGQTVVLDKLVDEDNPTAAIFYPIILPESLQVIVKIPKQPLRHYATNIPQAEVEKIANQLRFNLNQQYTSKATKKQLQQLYSLLIQPIESELQTAGVKTLVFLLDGTLRNVPMAALHDGKQYLLEKYAVSLNLGLQLLDPHPLAKQKLRVITAGLINSPPGFSQYPPLPAIEEEFELIANTGVETTKLLEQQFTSKALESKINSSNFNIVHIATHGEFSSRAEDTFILAADGPINVTQFDSILRSREGGKSSSMELLFLSACQTATGDNRAVLGLAGVAVRAGARSTIASLWDINDAATAKFVGLFYQELQHGNVSKAEALRLAQLKLLKDPQYKAPRFWSAYILIGNWL
ncbi:MULTISPECIES: CHAT domain-containing protein [Calothrix]|uniref:CHAT domain-containing protein n=2 Tax=Calothrix TaxID=1186 RepID=A0ABR8A4M0_9CYAN|nr:MULTISPECIES: CHAT domain-containing protein [Calothrix]MBD2194728.1 CHAT domain-containing protein [Calothrix parietina FACHB-288]MBD2225122.1 CHAT domain-containing protein [Calothrix anomala FACHB-343]